MKKIAAFMGFFVFSAIIGHTQELKAVPAIVTAVFKLKYPGASRPQWIRDGDAYAARFYFKRESCTARFDNKGSWLDETRKVNFGELRNNVRNALSQGQFANWRAYEVNEIQQRNKEVQYRITVRNSNETEQRYLLFDAKGQMIKVLTL
jgi:hypothetical protein